MTRLSWTTLGVMLCGSCTARTPQVGPEVPFPGGGTVTEFGWTNGLRLLVHANDAAPVAAVQLWFDVGSADDPPDQRGLAHLFEHLQFRATEDWPDGGFEDRQTRRGAVGVNATTWRDAMAFVLAVPADAVHDVLADERARLLGVRIDAAAIQREREVVGQEERGRNTDAGARPSDALWLASFQPHGYGRALIGDDFQTLKPADATAFRERAFTGRHLLIVVSGDVDPNDVATTVGRLFGDLPAGIEPTVPPAPVFAAGHTETVSSGGNRVHLGFEIPPASHADSSYLRLADLALSGGQSSPLPRALEDTGLATLAGSRFMALKQGGLWEFVAVGTPNVPAGQLESVIMATLDGALTHEDLDRARAQDAAIVWSQVADAAGQAAWLGWSDRVGLHWQAGLDALANVGTASDDEILGAASRWLKLSSASAVWHQALPAKPTWVSPGPAVTMLPLQLPSGRKRQAPDGGLARDETVSGLNVHIEPDPSVPLVWLRVGWKTGAVDDLSLGATWATGRLLLRGNADRSRDSFERAAEHLGARVGVEVDAESTWLTARVPAENWPQLAQLLGVSISSPSVDPTERDRVAGERLNLLALRAADPATMAGAAFFRARHGELHPYGRFALGTATSAAARDPDAWAAARARFQHPDVVSLAGDVDAGALDDLRAWRLPLPGPPRLPPPPDGSPSRRIILVDMPKATAAAVRIGGAALAVDDPELAALWLGLEALGTGSSSTLARSLRHERGLAYTVGADLIARTTGRGSWSVTWTTANTSVGESIGLAESILDEGPPADDVNRARDAAGFAAVWLRETAPGRAAVASVRSLTGWDEPGLRARMATLEDPSGTWKRVAAPETRVVVVAGPAAIIRKQLESIGEVEVWDRAHLLR